ncbi:uncharacterized [Tachysurus ichikawai]
MSQRDESQNRDKCSWDFIDRTDLLALAALRLEPPPDGRCERGWIRVHPRQGLHFGSPYRINFLASTWDGECQELALRCGFGAGRGHRRRHVTPESPQADYQREGQGARSGHSGVCLDEFTAVLDKLACARRRPS